MSDRPMRDQDPETAALIARYEAELAQARIQLEQEIARRQEIEVLYHQTLDMMGDYVFLYHILPDYHLEISWETGNLEKLCGYTAQQVMERGGWTTVIFAGDRERAQTALRDIVAGSPVDMEVRLNTRQGALRWVRAVARPMPSADGTVTQIYGTLRDVSDEKALHEEQTRCQVPNF